MEEQIDVSVLVLSYNHERYIAHALDSILNQDTVLNYEILVGDDASGDKSPEIIRDYSKRHPDIIKPVLRKVNEGANYNGWDLTCKARGKYIANLEGDDFWLDKHKMQKQFEFLENHSEYIGCCSKCLVVDEDGKPDYERSCHIAWNKRTYTLDYLLESWQLPGQAGTMMYRNIFREKDPRDYSVVYRLHPHVGDKTWALMLLSEGEFFCSNDIMTAYRYIDTGGCSNWFSIHHSNPYRNYDMFMYPCNLETWARKHMKLPKDKHFGKRNPYRFARFVEECVHEPSVQRFKYLGEMIRKSHQPLKYSWYVLKALIEME